MKKKSLTFFNKLIAKTELYIHTYVCMCMCKYMHICIYACTCVCLYMNVCACICIGIYVYACKCACAHIKCLLDNFQKFFEVLNLISVVLLGWCKNSKNFCQNLLFIQIHHLIIPLWKYFSGFLRPSTIFQLNCVFYEWSYHLFTEIFKEISKYFEFVRTAD